jgi:raffinose/stachyose/melibiose transport system substrate-binding protein
MVRRPWTKRLLSIVASADKVGKNLYAFSPGVSIFGVFTNDTLFNKLGLKVPQTFPQLLNVCRKAHAAGVTAYLLPGATQANIGNVIVNAAVATVYGQDPKWKSEREADKVTFAGSAGWRAALQELIDMNNANCFQPGYVGAVNPGVVAAFSQGQGLMIAGVSGLYASLKLANPSFAWSMHPWPASNDTKGKTAFVNLEYALAVSAKSVHPKEAQEFVDFIARPKQDELFSKILGWFTQNQFAKGDVPGWMSSIRPVLTQKRWAVNPQELWWNPSIQLALYTNEIGILTGQRSVDDVLKAMDDAFNKGPQ